MGICISAGRINRDQGESSGSSPIEQTPCVQSDGGRGSSIDPLPLPLPLPSPLPTPDNHLHPGQATPSLRGLDHPLPSPPPPSGARSQVVDRRCGRASGFEVHSGPVSDAQATGSRSAPTLRAMRAAVLTALKAVASEVKLEVRFHLPHLQGFPSCFVRTSRS